MNAFHLAAAFMALACAAPAAAQPAPPVVAVNLVSFAFAPKPIQLAAGRPVTILFSNRSGGGHNFTAPSFFASARILRGHVANGRIELAAGRSTSVTLIPAAGTYKAVCTHSFHKMLGMSAPIVVR